MAAGAVRSKLTGAHSNAGGGGERVLWTAIALMQRTEPDVISIVYSGDTNASKEQIIAKAKVRVVSPPPPSARNVPILITTLLLLGHTSTLRRPDLTSRSRRSRCTLFSSSRGGSSRIVRGRGSRLWGRAWARCTSHGRRCPSSSRTSL